MKKLRFVFVSTMEGYPWGGSEELWARAAEHLARQGHSVLASVRHWRVRRAQLEVLRELGIEISERRVTARDVLDYGFAKVTRGPLKRPAGFSAFNSWLKRAAPDLVCFSDGTFTSNPMMMKACRNLGFPYVSLGQANAVRFWPTDERLEDISDGMKNARLNCFVSRGNLELAELQIAERLERAEVVFNPFNVSYEATPEWRDPGRDNVWRLACVGRLEPEAKGQDLILRILDQDKWRGRPVRVTFYGSGPQERGLRKAVDMLKLQNIVHFAGHVEDIEQVWANNHALLLPSRYEGLPLALVEAMLCERTPIVTAVAGNPDVVSDGISGFLAQAATARHLDEAMERAWAQRADWRMMGKKAGELIRKIVPQDPAADFAARLLELADQPESAR